MTTNSYGSALPVFDFPQTVAKATRGAPRRLPLVARGIPIVATVGLAYYIGSQLASVSGPMATMGGNNLVDPRVKTMEDAYGDRSTLKNLEAAAQAYSASPVAPAAHPPTQANMRFRESLQRAKDHPNH